ncbi:class I SAM-dependent rRNA methyltransferase [Insolitispirillum peregrinum]|uniref:class I SAM-dependent rRNA methyltransferase n=1 Tax=Insolitispirillum peregrinum TaxID=80876 RepID=UPI0036100B31
MSTPSLPALTILKGRSQRLRKGHPWLFSNEVDMTPEARALPPGTLVQVIDAGSEQLGIATFNPHSLIAARMISRDPRSVIDQSFLAGLIGKADALRSLLFPRPFYRLVHSEADGLPGLIIDRYGDVFTVQANTAGMDRLLPEIEQALTALFQPRAIVLRNDSPVRGLEGLETYHRLASGTLDGPVEIEENGVRLFADLSDGQKTGWFYDQRPNRAFIASLAKGRRVIDLYCYAGGFGVQALAAGADSAVFVDRSAHALGLARMAAEANGAAGRFSQHEGDVFKVAADLAAAGETFGVVVADPPAFVKSRKDLAAGSKGYRKMARLAAALVEPGGFLLCGSCSHHMPEDTFLEEVSRGIAQAGRSGRILWRHGAGPDHPVHPSLPESAYLKSIVFQLD